ncbi:hypothetical protein H6775_01425 [Candidatus Nomurabacteria bacterium]|nr:hypothetical protein [Candidatus Nomurabacteria bacterium]
MVNGKSKDSADDSVNTGVSEQVIYAFIDNLKKEGVLADKNKLSSLKSVLVDNNLPVKESDIEDILFNEDDELS